MIETTELVPNLTRSAQSAPMVGLGTHAPASRLPPAAGMHPEKGYDAQTVPSGFMPGTAEERLMLAPPEQNLDTSDWREEEEAPNETP